MDHISENKVKNRKKYIEILGYVLTAISFLYIINIISNIEYTEIHIKNTPLFILHILIFGIIASSTVFIGAYSWKLILEYVNGAPVSTKDVCRVYFSSNIAKYLPGNFMHYAGRNYLGGKLGWKHTEMAFSSLLEYLFGFGLTGLIILGFAAVGLVNLPEQVSLAVNTPAVLKYAAVGVALGSLLVLATLIFRSYYLKARLNETINQMVGYARRFNTVRFLILLGKMLIITLTCFLINCLFYFYLCDIILNFQIKPQDFFNANAALSIASYTSILTPGVPGGIGVKESVSILLISAYGYPQQTLLVSLLVFRVTCILGDIVPFLLVKLFAK